MGAEAGFRPVRSHIFTQARRCGRSPFRPADVTSGPFGTMPDLRCRRYENPGMSWVGGCRFSAGNEGRRLGGFQIARGDLVGHGGIFPRDGSDTSKAGPVFLPVFLPVVAHPALWLG